VRHAVVVLVRVEREEVLLHGEGERPFVTGASTGDEDAGKEYDPKPQPPHPRILFRSGTGERHRGLAGIRTRTRNPKTECAPHRL